MNIWFFKSFATIFVAVLLVYANAAWALENCLEDGEAENRERAGYSESSIVTPAPDVPGFHSALNIALPPFSRIHCLVSHYGIGPMVQVSSGSRVTSTREGVFLKAAPPVGSVKVEVTNSLWFRAVFEWFASVSPPRGLSRNLLLSVFRI